MRTQQIGAVVLGLSLIALGVVLLRAEQLRVRSRTMATELAWIELRSEWWSLQARSARLKTPARIRERIEHLPFDLVPPAELIPPSARARFAAHAAQD